MAKNITLLEMTKSSATVKNGQQREHKNMTMKRKAIALANLHMSKFSALLSAKMAIMQILFNSVTFPSLNAKQIGPVKR